MKVDTVAANACRGCAACADACPVGAIRLVSDSEGFLSPLIDSERCVNCGVCLKVCPVAAPVKLRAPVAAFAAKHKDDSVRLQSSSGGLFTALARSILSSGGIVVGAALDDKSRDVKLVTADSMPKICDMRASKYVQANASGAYAAALSVLKAGGRVLFTGCPCQVAAMRSIAGDADGLYTADILCHGVPSPLLFKTYMLSLDEKHSSSVSGYRFRSKTRGWGMTCEYTANGKTYTRRTVSDPYGYAFLKGRIYRECCYSCAYARSERAGDITLGDYWGVLEEHPGFYSEKGVSAVLINTEKGKALFESVKPDLEYTETTVEKIARHNLNLTAPTPRPASRDGVYVGIGDMPPSVFVSSRLNARPGVTELIKAYTPWRIKKLLSGVMK